MLFFAPNYLTKQKAAGVITLTAAVSFPHNFQNKNDITIMKTYDRRMICGRIMEVLS